MHLENQKDYLIFTLGNMPNIYKSRMYLFISTYVIFSILFIIEAPLFLLFHSELSSVVEWGDWLMVLLSGLTMNLSLAGYLMIIPGLLILVSIYNTRYLKQILKVYLIITSLVISLIFISDLYLYSFWGFRIDSTIFTYLSSPKGVVANVSGFEIAAYIVVVAIWTLIQLFALKKIVVNRFPLKASKQKKRATIVIMVLLGLMFIPIRGGITASTMNPGYAYFSNNMFLNHAALNPVFNMFYSMKQKKDLNKQFRFMDNAVAHKIFDNLMSYNKQDSVPVLLTTDRPNIVFIILESFGAGILEPLGGEKGVAPNLNKLTEEGIFFRNMYANSFRTDRGIVSVLGGYPAQPNMSILKYTNKVHTLNSIPKSLVDNGYNASFLYGGDLNFAQMELFVVTQKVTNIIDDDDFPMEMKMTKWGVPDAFTFDRLAGDIASQKEEPFVKMFLTLSSHEPFDVPANKFSNPYLNSVAYTDSCLGVFIDRMKQSPQWDNSLIVLVPDHDMRYPRNISHYAPERHDIFMLWLGGAVANPVVIDDYCMQVDIASTLLNQLNIDTNEFTFSKNILNPSVEDFAFYTFSNGFGILTENGTVVYDCNSKKVIVEEGNGTDSLLLKGKAFLQCLYDDIHQR